MFKKIRRKRINSIIEENLDYLVRFAYYRLEDKSGAEDIVYEAVLKFLEKDLSNVKIESVRLYLFKIVYNLCLDRLRNNGKEAVSIESVEVEDEREETSDDEKRYEFKELLASLPDTQSSVIRMKIMDELSFTEISQLLSIPASTAKSRYKAGMEKLRKRFINQKKR